MNVTKCIACGLTIVAFSSSFQGRLWASDAQELLTYQATDRPLAGQELFERQWTRKDSLSGNGDGLGPMFNARSCVACHHQQGSGGGGGIIHNVDLLTLVDVTSGTGNGSQRLTLEGMHPGFKTANSVTLHAESSQGSVAYAKHRQSLLDGKKLLIHGALAMQRTQYGNRDALKWGPFVVERSQRQTPSLFGAGLIDKISDKYFADMAIETQKKWQELSQTLTRESDPSKAEEISRKIAALQRQLQLNRAARFGWKGQTATLKDFVAGACANELGLQTKGIPQAATVMQASYRNDHVDMTAKQVAELVEYIASLPPPKRWNPSSGCEADGMARGAILFSQAKCQTCHVQDVEEVRGIYSDLRLHDMGYALSDPSGPALAQSRPRGEARRTVKPEDYQNPDLVITESLNTGPPYYGTPVQDLASAWRTPPLWGVRDSAPYMHDGRASTLDEAIKLHDGEAADSASAYRRMTAEQRKDLLAFVYSLGAP